MHVGGQVRNGTTKGINDDALAAYNAPFPNEDHKQGVRQFPNLVPATLRTPSAEPNKEAWNILRQWEKPFLCAFSDKDPIFAGVENSFLKLVPGCKDMPRNYRKCRTFFTEDQPEAMCGCYFINQRTLTNSYTPIIKPKKFYRSRKVHSIFFIYF